jgi:hypothetical protein
MFATITEILKAHPRITATIVAGAMFLAVTGSSQARCHHHCVLGPGNLANPSAGGLLWKPAATKPPATNPPAVRTPQGGRILPR